MRVLVVGAGGGLELELFARSNPRWRFIAVDPSAHPMSINPAATRLGHPVAESHHVEGEIRLGAEELRRDPACVDDELERDCSRPVLSVTAARCPRRWRS